MEMQDTCVYCDKCYAGNVIGTSKNLCLNCLEHIAENCIYEAFNPLKNYDIIYDKNKIKCEVCNQSHNLFVKTNLCSQHKNQLFRLCDSYDDYDSDDYYDYEDDHNKFIEIKDEISSILARSNFTLKVTRIHVKTISFANCQFVFIYQDDKIVCKFIYEYGRLVLIIGNKIYTTSCFYDRFREMYFGKSDYTLLEITQILEVLKNHTNIKYDKVKNFDHFIKLDSIISALTDRFETLDDPLIVIQFDRHECNNCGSYNHETSFIYNSNEILRIINNESTLTLWIQNRIYSNNKDGCLHFNSYFQTKNVKQKDIFNYINLNISYNIEFKSYLEIYRLVVDYPSRFKETRKWSDIVKSNM
jgi:hypothetical protein